MTILNIVTELTTKDWEAIAILMSCYLLSIYIYEIGCKLWNKYKNESYNSIKQKELAAREDYKYNNYKVKCKSCGKVSQMTHSIKLMCRKEEFHVWIHNNKHNPFDRQCSCDNGSMLIHEIIGYDL